MPTKLSTMSDQTNVSPEILQTTYNSIDADGDLILILTKPKNPQVAYTHSRVSSKHMTLASPVFKAMLAPNVFQEGTILATTGKVTVPLPDDDIDAFTILLYIIHARNNLVPLNVSVQQLTDITILVDKYLLHDAVCWFVDMWFKNLNNEGLCCSTSRVLSPRELTKWLWIAWVFQKKELYKDLTKLAVKGFPLSYNNATDSLFIPQKHIGAPLPSSRVVKTCDPKGEALIMSNVVVHSNL